MFAMPVRYGLTITSLMLALGLSACSGEDCPAKGLETAAAYGRFGLLREGQVPYFHDRHLPDDQWVRNPEVEHFLRETLPIEGGVSLRTKHGLQCLPRTEPSTCVDRYTCSATVPIRIVEMCAAIPFGFNPGWKCVNRGETYVRAEIGPGQTVTATTYRHCEQTRPEK